VRKRSSSRPRESRTYNGHFVSARPRETSCRYPASLHGLPDCYPVLNHAERNLAKWPTPHSKQGALFREGLYATFLDLPRCWFEPSEVDRATFPGMLMQLAAGEKIRAFRCNSLHSLHPVGFIARGGCHLQAMKPGSKWGNERKRERGRGSIQAIPGPLASGRYRPGPAAYFKSLPRKIAPTLPLAKWMFSK
jgi:hypothetical protein